MCLLTCIFVTFKPDKIVLMWSLRSHFKFCHRTEITRLESELKTYLEDARKPSADKNLLKVKPLGSECSRRKEEGGIPDGAKDLDMKLQVRNNHLHLKSFSNSQGPLLSGREIILLGVFPPLLQMRYTWHHNWLSNHITSILRKGHINGRSPLIVRCWGDFCFHGAVEVKDCDVMVK